jgi:hypothetical protein
MPPKRTRCYTVKTFMLALGAIGGKKGKTGGFYANRELASQAGKIGGLVSRRGPNKLSSSHVAAIKKVYGQPEAQRKSLTDMIKEVLHV